MRRLALAVAAISLLGSCGTADDARFVDALQTPTPSATPSPSPTDLIPTADLRFAVIGDFGSGDANEQAVADRMCRWRQRHDYDIVFTTGDNVYPNGSRARFGAAFFQPMACLLDHGVQFHASLGNHDIVTDNGRPEIEEPAFGMEKRNYVIREGGVRVVLADSNSLQRDWLRRALTARATDRWTIAVFHHPVYSPGTHGSTPGFRPGLPRMFRRKGVDLVLNGHDHLYSVTRPLRKIRYVVTGGGGAGLYPCRDFWFVERCSSVHHFLYVRATTDEIKVKAIPTTGPPLDRFSTAGR